MLLSDGERVKLEKIAKSLGITLEELLASNKPVKQIIEDYNRGNLKVLND